MSSNNLKNQYSKSSLQSEQSMRILKIAFALFLNKYALKMHSLEYCILSSTTMSSQTLPFKGTVVNHVNRELLSLHGESSKITQLQSLSCL